MEPKHLLLSWEEIAARIASRGRPALLTEFDGTLVRLNSDPNRIHLSPSLKTLLSRIAENDVTVGVVSGRTVDDLFSRVGVNHIWYVGTHGLSLRPPSGLAFCLASGEETRLISRAMQAIRRRLNGTKEIVLECKGPALAVHFRGASWTSQIRALTAVREITRKLPGLRLLKGKRVWELLPDRPSSRWHGIQYVLRKHACESAQVIYLGGDPGDEEFFHGFDGTTVAVGRHRQTYARYYLDSPAEVHRFLELLQSEVRPVATGQSCAAGAALATAR